MVMWKGMIWVEHCAIFSLASSGGIQGLPADVAVTILKSKGIKNILKWVDDFAFIHMPAKLLSQCAMPLFDYDLDTILDITRPLGIPWHCVKDKGQDFVPIFEYSGFHWDLCSHTVSLPEKKCLKATMKLMAFIATACELVLCAACASLHCTLQHITFVYRDGRSYLPCISTFLSKFPDGFTCHHVPASILSNLHWWSTVLTGPPATCSLMPHRRLDPDIWADASTSWGIGLVMGGQWTAWQLKDGWKAGGRDIGWAESIALKLAVLWWCMPVFMML